MQNRSGHCALLSCVSETACLCCWMLRPAGLCMQNRSGPCALLSCVSETLCCWMLRLLLLLTLTVIPSLISLMRLG